MEWPRRLGLPTLALTASTRVGPILARAAAATDPVAGHVVSVYAGAVNLRIGADLVTVARSSVGGLPCGIGLDDGFEPRAAGVRPGDPVTVIGRVVRLGPVSIDLAAARPWSPNLPHRPIPVDLAERAAVLRSAVEPRGAGRAPLCAADRRRPTGSASPTRLVDDLFAARLRAFRAAARHGAPAAVASAGRALVGLGVGLTPSGDDVLVGFSAGRAAIGAPAASALATDLAVDWSAWADGRTTDVAVAFHRTAAQGDFAERLHDALAAILDGPVASIPDAATCAAAWGATSGRDTLRGVLVALESVVSAARPVVGAA